MVCPACGKRSGRRACPALGREICAVCCGTKRLVEIRCVPTCRYLATARAHPPAIERRQHERDSEILGPMVRGLGEPQGRLLFLVLRFLAGRPGDALVRMTDADVADCAGSVAATLETAARGLIYEHRPTTLAAQRLASDVKAFFAELSDAGWKSLDADAAVVLRRIEAGARGSSKTLEGGETAYLGLVQRAVRSYEAENPEIRKTGAERPALILP